MKNFKQKGDIVTLFSASAIASGAGLLVGSVFGITQNAGAAGDSVEVLREGVFTHAKNSAEAWTVGAKIYWDNTNKRITTTVGSNTLVGVLTAAKGGTDTTARVLLDGAIR